MDYRAGDVPPTSTRQRARVSQILDSLHELSIRFTWGWERMDEDDQPRKMDGHVMQRINGACAGLLYRL